MTDRITRARQLRRALQLWAAQVTDESAMMEMASVYPAWSEKQGYKAGDIVACGSNTDGEPQLYRVIQGHVSQADWRPDLAAALFKRIGFAEDGTAIWTQPLGAQDAYMKGDEVYRDGARWRSLLDNNVWQPGVYGWQKVEG